MVLEKTLESSLDSKQSKPVNPKGINPEYSLEGLMLKLQYFGQLGQRANSLEKALMLGKTECRKRRGQQMMRWLDGIADSGHEFEQAPGDSEGQGREAWHAAVHEVAKSRTWFSDLNDTVKQ